MSQHINTNADGSYEVLTSNDASYTPNIYVQSVGVANSVTPNPDSFVLSRGGLNLQRVGGRNYAAGNSENLVRLAENFANANAPVNPLVGQLWFDTKIDPDLGTETLKVFKTDGIWTVVGKSPPPVINVVGDATGSWDSNTGLLALTLSPIANVSAHPNPAGTYTPGSVTVDSSGRVVAISNAAPTDYANASDVLTKSANAETKIGGLNASFFNATTKIQEGGNALVPRGVIVMWSPTTGAIPAGWGLCDGSNGTPNLVGQFIRAGSSSSASATAASSVTPTITISASTTASATTSATAAFPAGVNTGDTALTIDQMPAHTHKLGNQGVPQKGTGFGYTGSNGVDSSILTNTNSQGGGQAHNHTMPTATHTHSVTLPAHTHTATSTPISGTNVVPSHWVLAFIMKL